MKRTPFVVLLFPVLHMLIKITLKNSYIVCFRKYGIFFSKSSDKTEEEKKTVKKRVLKKRVLKKETWKKRVLKKKSWWLLKMRVWVVKALIINNKSFLNIRKPLHSFEIVFLKPFLHYNEKYANFSQYCSLKHGRYFPSWFKYQNDKYQRRSQNYSSRREREEKN